MAKNGFRFGYRITATTQDDDGEKRFQLVAQNSTMNNKTSRGLSSPVGNNDDDDDDEHITTHNNT